VPRAVEFKRNHEFRELRRAERGSPVKNSDTNSSFWTGNRGGQPRLESNLVYHDDYVTTEIGQVSTQFDGAHHIGVRTVPGNPTSDAHYNGVKRVDAYERSAGGQVIGLGALGVELVPEHMR